MKMKKCLAIILALVMALGCMSITAFADTAPDLSVLETGAKIRFGTQDESPVEWVIGGDGETGMSVPTGCIALVSSDLVVSRVKFNEDSDDGNAYATSILKTVVEGAVTFTDDEQAAIKSRTLAGNQTYGSDCDGVAGDSVTAKVWAPTTKDAYGLSDAGLSAASFDYWLCSPGGDTYMASFGTFDGYVSEEGNDVYLSCGVRAALYLDASYISGITAVSGAENTYTLVLTAPEEPEEDPSGVDLSMLETGVKIQFGTQNDTPVEWVIGGDGTTGMSVPEGCIALVSSGFVASGVVFDTNGVSNVYATSNLKNAVESAVTFTDDEQAAIQSRTLQGGQTSGADCDGVAGDTVIAKVWALTASDATALYEVSLSGLGYEYLLCSPGYNESLVSFVSTTSEVKPYGAPVNSPTKVRAALYIDLSKVYGAEAVTGAENTYTLDLTAPTTFLTSFTLSKDYNDKYTADTKSTAVNETVSFTITPVTENAPAFASSTFTMTVTDGVGEAEVDLPDLTDVSKVGEYWYEIEETAGTTAGVTYDDATYYLHLIVSYKDGEFGFSSAAIHTTEPVDGVYSDDDKIDTVSNSYGEGTLTVAQETTVNGEASDEDAFKVTVTFTAPTGTTVIGDITYGDLTIEPEDWENGSVSVEIELKGGETVTFENIPDGVTYTVEQTEKNEDKGYTLDEVAFDVTDETGDSVSDANVASGTIGDTADTVTFTNSKSVPIDVGVILENGAFIALALGAIAAGAWLVISKRRKAVDAE